MPSADGEDNGRGKRQPQARRKSASKSNGISVLQVIFGFTRRIHLLLFAIAFTLSALAATIQPLTSICVGKLMNSFSRFAAGTIDGDDLEDDTKPWIFGLIFLGIAACSLRGLFCCAWIVFGESQARVVREELFSSLVIRDFGWFEAQASGVSSLLGRIQVYECKNHASLVG